MASVEACLEALALGKTQAVVYDDAILRYYINEKYSDVIEVLPETFEQQQYGIVLPQAHPQREAINLAILDLLASSSYQDILFRYLGEQ